MLEPVLSPLWALIVHGEQPSSASWVGGAIILGATVAKGVVDARAPRPA
jgi:drug/metabolite transporter (DMT)-like permease